MSTATGTILFRRGVKANIPSAVGSTGEPLVTTDTHELFFGTGTANTPLKLDWSNLLNVPGTATATPPANTPAVSNNFLTAYNSSTGVFSMAQPSAANLSNGVTGSGAVMLAASPTTTGTLTAATIAPTTISIPATGTATSSSNYSDNGINLHSNYWNGTSSVDMFWTIQGAVAGTGTTPWNQLIFAPPQNAPGFVSLTLNQLGTATSSSNFNSAQFKLQGTFWTGTALGYDSWSIQNVLGTGTNPTSSLVITHSGTSGGNFVALDTLVSVNKGTAPTTNCALDVAGNINTSSNYLVNGGVLNYANVGAEAALGNPAANGYVLSSTTSGTRSWIAPPATGVSSVFGRTGAVVAATGDYAVAQVTGAAPLASPSFTGNVGIGTSTVTVGRLQIEGTGSPAQLALTTSDWVSGSTGSYLFAATGAGTGNTYAQIGAQSAGGTAWSNLVLQGGGGNVGIGTTSPLAIFNVQTAFTSATSGLDSTQSFVWSNSTNFASASFASTDDRILALALDPVTGAPTFRTAGTVPLGFNVGSAYFTGNVGIRTTSTSSYTLNVNGSAYIANNLTVGTSGTDYGIQFLPNVNGNSVFWIDNYNNALRISNGSTPGGYPVTVDNGGNVTTSSNLTIGGAVTSKSTRLASSTDLNTITPWQINDCQNPTNGVTGQTWHNLMTVPSSDTGYISQLNFAMTENYPNMWLRTKAGTWGSWTEILHAGNYNSYAPTLTGGGASGTWGINVSGTAALADNLTGSPNITISGLNAGGAYLSGFHNSSNDYSTLFLGGSISDQGNGTYTVSTDGSSNYFAAVRMDNVGINFYTGASTGGTSYTLTDAQLATYKRMTIVGGNVGIGLPNPAYTLQVVGNYAVGQNTNGTAVMDAYSGLAYYGCNSATNGISINASGQVGIGMSTTGGAAYTLDVNGDIHNNSWQRVSGTGGIYWQDYAGGWNMSDSTWLRSYNGKNIYTAGVVRGDGGFQTNGGANSIGSDGTFYTKTPGVATSLSGANYGCIEVGDPTPPNSGTNYIVGYHQVSYLSGYGYRQHLSIGQYRPANGAWGSAFIGVGGNDSYPTVAYTFDYSGNFSAPGAITAGGNITAYSDLRLKENIRPISDWRTILDGIRGYRYNWNETGRKLLNGLYAEGQEDYGLVAQELREVMPEAVVEQPLQYVSTTSKEPREDIADQFDPENPFLTVKREMLIPVLVEAVKDLKAENEELRQIINLLREKVGV